MARSFTKSIGPLCHAFYFINKVLHLEVLIAVVEKDHADLSSVVFIDDPSPNVDWVLPGQSRPRSYSAVSKGRAGPTEPSRNFSLASGWDNGFFKSANVISSCQGAASFGENCIRVQLFDEKPTEDLLVSVHDVCSVKLISLHCKYPRKSKKVGPSILTLLFRSIVKVDTSKNMVIFDHTPNYHSVPHLQLDVAAP